MEQPMMQTEGGIDLWPFTRLLITTTALGLAAHFYAGWSPDCRHLARLPANIFEILSLCAMVSFALADLYILLFLIPLYAAAVLNDWFYDLLCGAPHNASWRRSFMALETRQHGGKFAGIRTSREVVKPGKNQSRIRVRARFEYADGPEQKRAIGVLAQLLAAGCERLRAERLNAMEPNGEVNCGSEVA